MLFRSTAISAAATAANVIYSTTARTGVAYRVVGYVESTQATAGTWATAPSTIQGYGGQALAAMSSLGYGQTWQNVQASRAMGTTYYNTTGRPIMVKAGSGTNNTDYSLNVDGVGTFEVGQAVGVVPPGRSYSLTLAAGSTAATFWTELR